MGFGIWWRSQCGSASCLACGVSRAGYCHHTLCPQPVAVGPQLFNKSDQLGGKVPDCLGSARQSCLQPETPSNTFRITLGVIESCKCSTGPWGTARAPLVPAPYHAGHVQVACWGAEAMEDIACCPMGGCMPARGSAMLVSGRVVLDFPTVGQGRFRVTCFSSPGTGQIPLVGY